MSLKTFEGKRWLGLVLSAETRLEVSVVFGRCTTHCRPWQRDTFTRLDYGRVWPFPDSLAELRELIRKHGK